MEEEEGAVVRPDVDLGEMPYLMGSVDEWRRTFILNLMANSDIHPWILIDNMLAVEHWLKTGDNIATAPSGIKAKPKA